MIARIRKLIEVSERFLVAAHMNPDGDAISSTLALGNALVEMGKEVVFYNGDPVPFLYRFLPGASSLVNSLDSPEEKPFDVGFILDSGELRRTGEHLVDKCRVLVNIDHHTNSERFSDFFWVDEKASSTGTLIYRLLDSFPGYQISLQVATCLYTALLSDTGSFRFANTDEETFRLASKLLETGVDAEKIATQLYENQEERTLHLLAQALNTLKVSDCGRIASISVTNACMQKTGTGPEHTDGFINYPRSIRGIEIAILFREIESGIFKVGLRSKGKVDVARVAREFGGGGHSRAAGATLNGTLEEISERIIRYLQQLLP